MWAVYISKLFYNNLQSFIIIILTFTTISNLITIPLHSLHSLFLIPITPLISTCILPNSIANSTPILPSLQSFNIILDKLKILLTFLQLKLWLLFTDYSAVRVLSSCRYNLKVFSICFRRISKRKDYCFWGIVVGWVLLRIFFIFFNVLFIMDEFYNMDCYFYIIINQLVIFDKIYKFFRYNLT